MFLLIFYTYPSGLNLYIATSTAVEIAGIGIHPFGRFTDTTVTEMGVHAVRAADPKRILTISSFEPNAAKHAGSVERLGLSALNFHDFPPSVGL